MKQKLCHVADQDNNALASAVSSHTLTPSSIVCGNLQLPSHLDWLDVTPSSTYNN